MAAGPTCGAFTVLSRFVGEVWCTDDRRGQTMREAGHEFAPQGEGNAISVEFNLMYRWHATSSQADTAWVDAIFQQMFDGKSGAEVR